MTLILEFGSIRTIVKDLFEKPWLHGVCDCKYIFSSASSDYLK